MPELYAAIGRTAKISIACRRNDRASSNLATNLLLDFVGVEYARKVLWEAEMDGVELRRGVEDHAAHDKGINNEVTADGLVRLLSAVRGDFLSTRAKSKRFAFFWNNDLIRCFLRAFPPMRRWRIRPEKFPLHAMTWALCICPNASRTSRPS